jgi:hypothetical protein
MNNRSVMKVQLFNARPLLIIHFRLLKCKYYRQSKDSYKRFTFLSLGEKICSKAKGLGR